ncbi:unnamed protein product [Blepharisma stoltei]|uniref:Uncharacterized protein n=1 Tax=Blepharisma stoltei TaxID=1481888 RepID=A0AAU9JKL0_9CILI|nr:unnamed protein product [Blepharisma stoltei]
MIEKEDEKSKRMKAENLKKIKYLLLESMNKEGSIESDLFGREDMISTASSKAHNEFVCFIMQDTPYNACISKAISKYPEESAVFKQKSIKGHRRRKSENNLL